jgi:hypothetical protein
VKRRHVLAALAAGGGVLAIGWGLMPPRQRLNPSQPLVAIDKTTALNGWVRIGEDDTVTVVMAKSEMGQGAFTGLAMLLAEELDARWDQVRFEQSPNDNIYNNLAGVADGLPFHPDNQGMLKSGAQWLVRKTMREVGIMFTGGTKMLLSTTGDGGTDSLQFTGQNSGRLAALYLLPYRASGGKDVSIGLYDFAMKATKLPIIMTSNNALLVLVSTVLICITSGALAINKLRSADPADSF